MAQVLMLALPDCSTYPLTCSIMDEESIFQKEVIGMEQKNLEETKETKEPEDFQVQEVDDDSLEEVAGGADGGSGCGCGCGCREAE